MSYHIPSDPTIPLQNNNELLKNYTGIVEYSNGTKCWLKTGKLHREDGPALECSKGYKEWWFQGKQYSEKDYLKKIKILERIVNELPYS